MQRTGPVGVPADPVVLAPLGDLFAVLEPVNLRHQTSFDSTALSKWVQTTGVTRCPAPPYLRFRVSVDLAREGNRHALEDFVVLQLPIEGWRRAPSCRVFVVLHVVVRFFHWGTLQSELDFTDEPLLEAGDFVFLQDNRTRTDLDRKAGGVGGGCVI